MSTIAVLGSGGWGTAMAVLLANKPGNDVRLWSARPETAVDLNEKRENVRQLRGVPIPASVRITADAHIATQGASIWIEAVPTAYLRGTLERLAPHCSPEVSVVSLTKGIETERFLRPSEIVRECLGVRRVAVLSGPNHAEEIARRLPASAVVASEDEPFAVTCQELLSNDRFRIYTNKDVIGVELAGALKNVMGIAAGLCDGLKLGDNAKAALLTRGLDEMMRFGVAHQAERDTFAGLAGMGDLIATCFSPHGRNRKLGERLARGESLASITSGPQVAEGVNTARSVHRLAQKHGLDLPIMSAVYRVLEEGQSPLDAVQELLSRQQKGEGWSLC
ncbi:MAG: NAD(P)H-dependent glycerol-3-phosphate dehydrogenase [Gemmataceae bacterium]